MVKIPAMVIFCGGSLKKQGQKNSQLSIHLYFFDHWLPPVRRG